MPFGSLSSDLLLRPELSANCLCCHHISSFAGAILLDENSSLANPELKRGVQLIQLLSPKDPDLLLTDQVFHAKGTSDYSIPSSEDVCVDER